MITFRKSNFCLQIHFNWIFEKATKKITKLFVRNLKKIYWTSETIMKFFMIWAYFLFLFKKPSLEVVSFRIIKTQFYLFHLCMEYIYRILKNTNKDLNKYLNISIISRFYYLVWNYKKNLTIWKKNEILERCYQIF